jgi:hypothetical protein
VRDGEGEAQPVYRKSRVHIPIVLNGISTILTPGVADVGEPYCSTCGPGNGKLFIPMIDAERWLECMSKDGRVYPWTSKFGTWAGRNSR